MSNNPTPNTSFTQQLREQEEEDGRSWQELFDENAILREMVRSQMAAKQQQQQSSSSSSAPSAEQLQELTQLRTELLSSQRLTTHFDELTSSMADALSDALSKLARDFDVEDAEEEEGEKRHQQQQQCSAKFRDGKPPPACLPKLCSAVDTAVRLLTNSLPAHLEKEADKSRKVIERETHSLQQIVAELGGRLCHAEQSMKEQQEKQQSHLQQKTVKEEEAQELQQKVEELSFEMETKTRQQERMTSLLREQLSRSQKQLEQMTAEIQKSALRAGSQQQQQSSAYVPTAALPRARSASFGRGETPIVSAFAPLDPSSNNNNNNSNGGSSNTSFTASSPIFPPSSSQPNSTRASPSGIHNSDSDVMRQENIALIHRLASQQEKVWMLESTKKSYEAEIDLLNNRIVYQASALRMACGVYSNKQTPAVVAAQQQQQSSSSTAPPPTSTSSASSGFASLFSRNRSSSGSEASAPAIPRGSGGIPIEIVHSTHLQLALEDAWKRLAELGALPAQESK